MKAILWNLAKQNIAHVCNFELGESEAKYVLSLLPFFDFSCIALHLSIKEMDA